MLDAGDVGVMTLEAKVSTPAEAGPDRLSEKRATLKAALESRVFQARPRLAELLKYLCDRYFEGEADSIKEYSIATEVFRRPASFDQATDSIVRVEVFRLRKRLREFYDGEGASQAFEIVIATGHYRPEFIDRLHRLRPASREARENSLDRDSGDQAETLGASIMELPARGEAESLPAEERPLASGAAANTGWRRAAKPVTVSIGVATVLLLVAGAIFWRNGRLEPKSASAGLEVPADDQSIPLAGPEVRIRCGYSRPIFKDDEGNLWTGDRYFSGGFATELPHQFIARTRNPELYLTARNGVFSYKIPLAPGTYELHLHFAETTYSPASTLGGGENSRVFDIHLNGHPLLTQFDIAADAGADTADVRVFRDVSPDRDGYLHLDFNGSLGLPMINGIEIVPGLPHRLRPIRMVAQDSFFVDKAGNLWMPDSYFSGGRLAADKTGVNGTPEPGLFAGERYGNFTYALPVAEGTYTMTLYFSEKYWGVRAAQGHAGGQRIFNIYCNGVALARDLDIAGEAGPAQALVKVYRGLRSDAQGKLVVSFIPEVNYASIDAIEVEQERP